MVANQETSIQERTIMSTTNPFDFSQMLSKFTPEEFAKQFPNAINFDFDAVKEAQNKNMELIMNTNKAIADGSRALLERQSEMMQEAISEAVKTTQDLQSTGSATDLASKQVEIIKLAYETTIKNSQEISDMTKKLQEEVTEKVNARVVESLQEIKDILAKTK